MFLDSFGFKKKLFSDTIICFFISPDARIEIFLILSKLFVIVMFLEALLSVVICPRVNSFGTKSKPGFSPTRKLVFIIVFSV